MVEASRKGEPLKVGVLGVLQVSIVRRVRSRFKAPSSRWNLVEEESMRGGW